MAPSGPMLFPLREEGMARGEEGVRGGMKSCAFLILPFLSSSISRAHSALCRPPYLKDELIQLLWRTPCVLKIYAQH
jgi:hypothetical protein